MKKVLITTGILHMVVLVACKLKKDFDEEMKWF